MGSRENLLGSGGQRVNRTGRTAAVGFRSQLLHSHNCVASSRFSTLCSAWTVSYQMTKSHVCMFPEYDSFLHWLLEGPMDCIYK